jgi:DNA-binding NarL/FixJ family response regulator
MTSGTVRLTSSGPQPPSRLAGITRLDAVDIDPGGSTFDLRGRRVWVSVADRDTASRTLRAVQRGADVVVHLALAEPERSAFLDELHRVASEISELQAPQLDPFQLALVGHLREGLSLREAATRLHVSSRTADRRLAEIRAVLGVSSTSEVLAALAD